MVRVRIDLRVEEGTVVLSDYNIKNEFSKDAVVQLTSYDSLSEGKIAGKIDVTCNIISNIDKKQCDMVSCMELFKEYMHEHAKEIQSQEVGLVS